MPWARESKPYLEEDIDKFTGINNRKPWESLSINELSVGTNIDIDLNNGIGSRSGQTLIKSGNYKDAQYFPESHITLTVKDNTNLVALDEAWVESSIRTNVGEGRMVYAYHAYKIFYTNERVIGYVAHKTDHTLAIPTRTFRANPLPGHLLEVHGFRLWIARDKELWFTDPGKFHSIWMQRNIRQMPYRLTMIHSVGTGMFISDLSNTYFAGGINPYKMPLIKVKPYPAIPYTGGVIDGILIGEGIPGKVVWWVSKEGICVGTEKGDVHNLTEMRYDFPDCVTGTSLHRFKNNISQFITTVIS